MIVFMIFLFMLAVKFISLAFVFILWWQKDWRGALTLGVGQFYLNTYVIPYIYASIKELS